jgi:O-antigen ligase
MGFFISLLLIFEGLGFNFGHEISYYLIILYPLFLLVYLKLTGRERELKIPKSIAVFYGIFLFFLFLSTVFSVNTAQSVGGLPLYLSLFFISIISFNNKKEIGAWFIYFLIFASFLLVAISLTGLFFPKTGFSLLYSSLNDHNNLGDFLLIPMIAGTYFVFENKRKNIGLFTLLFSTPIFLLSFSRSAFTAYIIAAIAMFVIFKKKSASFYKVVLLVFVLVGIFYFIPNVNLDSCCRVFNKYISHRDDLISFRDSFFISAARGIRDFPLLGVGYGNFGKISFRYNDLYLFWTRTSHNIFLDIASEIGLPALVAFLAVIVYVLKKSRKNVLFFVFVGLLANFQFYYSFKIYTVLFIFFILLGILLEESKDKTLNINRNRLLGLFLIPLIVIQFGFISKTFINFGKYKTALMFDPFNKNLNQKIINDSVNKGAYREGTFYRNLYGRIYYSDMEVTEYLASIDLKYNHNEEALSKYERSMEWNPYEGDLKKRLIRIYYLTEKVKGKKAAIDYLNFYTKRVNSMWEYTSTSFKATADEVNREVNPPLVK